MFTCTQIWAPVIHEANLFSMDVNSSRELSTTDHHAGGAAETWPKGGTQQDYSYCTIFGLWSLHIGL